jgi:hypothetical protein
MRITRNLELLLSGPQTPTPKSNRIVAAHTHKLEGMVDRSTWASEADLVCGRPRDVLRGNEVGVRCWATCRAAPQPPAVHAAATQHVNIISAQLCITSFRAEAEKKTTSMILWRGDWSQVNSKWENGTRRKSQRTTYCYLEGTAPAMQDTVSTRASTTAPPSREECPPL